MRAEHLARVMLLVGTLAVLALVGELGMRLFYAVPPTWIEPQTRHLRSPLLGWVLPPSSHSYTIDAPVSVNSLGLRDDELAFEKPAGERRILCLGDSFTFALGVRFEDLYVQQLERMLNERHAPPRFQAINAGVAGYNTRQELIYLRTDGLRLEPDLVTVGFYWNDLVHNGQPLPDLDAPRIDPEQTWRDAEAAHAIPAPIRNALRQSVLLYQLVSRVKTVLQRLDPPTDEYTRVQTALLEGDAETLEPYWRETQTRLLEIAETARAHGIPALLIAFPNENQIRHDFPRLRYAERLREIWSPTGLPFVDLGPAYRAALESGDNPFLPYDLHPNAKGMEIAAEAVYRAVREAGLLGLPQAP